ncbi:hypothetical protein PVAP13_5NG341600 [Panicum virgatum]|uniref:Uncharacterized protein n=1 Tax=Panicum virgatum TaxID=38727 RepID=A0A8T0RUZ3_PANVG|nr:hypothetical protein PVAP13_5NG341600 [Panicum virgatum]
MPGPFPAEIRAAPLPSPLLPLPPFLLPPASLFVFFPATLSGDSSTSSGSTRVSSAASTTARARASLSPSRERDPWWPPYASSPASTPPRPRRPAKVQLDLLGLHLLSAGSRSGRSCSPSPRPPPPPPRPRSPRPHSAPPSTPARPLRWCISLARPHSISSAMYSAVPSSTAVPPGTAQLAKSASIIRRAPAKQV